MNEETSKRTRVIVAVVVVIGAVLAIAITPILVDQMLPDIIEGQLARFQQLSAAGDPKAPLIEKTPYLVSFFYPLWMALAMFGGVVALVFAKPMIDGKRWAKGLVLLGMAMPSMGGAYMLVPWINFVGSVDGGFPPAVVIMAYGLIPYFAVLLAEKTSLAQKAVDFFVFLFLGVQGAHSFSNGHASMRIQWMHPARPLWPDGTRVLWVSTQFMWLGTIALILAIYFLGTRKKAGWYLALIGGITTTIANIVTHVVRHATYDYLYGALLGGAIVILMLVPYVKAQLVDNEEAPITESKNRPAYA